jgi:signal transduction histidine kinase
MIADAHLGTLASLPLFASVPRTEFAWLSERGEVFVIAPDAILRDVGAAISDMWIVMGGRVAVHAPKGGSWRKFVDVGPGAVLGAMPYSRMQSAPARLIAEEETTLFALSISHFPGLVRECPELTAALVHHMLDRTRDYRTAQMHDDRMQSLGRLAAGLAHELNNPASGAASHARSLLPLLNDVQAASSALARAHLSDAQIDRIDAFRRSCADAGEERSPLEVADREDEFAEWLQRHGIDATPAAVLATSNVSVAALDELAAVLPAEALQVAVRWAASSGAMREAVSHIVAATGRVHDLVGAVKGFTFMDRQGVPEDVSVARGIADSIAMLESKARAKSVRVTLESAEHVPAIHAYGSEVNQVWEKLIDNAIDAARVQGSVTVTVTTRGDFVVVRIADDGPGIPEEHRARIFDPFFTTKPVGQGTGMGLEIARRFVHLNEGTLDFTSQPGHTVFRVRLPVSGTRTPAQRGSAAAAT